MMDGLTRKTFTTSRSFTYTYYDTAPTKPAASDKPALLLLHGFPDSAYLWSHVLTYLDTLPHRIIVPDLLGYGDTSKPTDPSQYNSKAMAEDITELLTDAGVDKFVSVGHDWGSFLAQRMWLWQPSRVAGLVNLNVAYFPPDPSQPFDLQAALDFFEEATGYPRYAYWELFAADDGAKILEEHLESFWTVLHGAGDHWMRDMFCNRGAMRNFLLADQRVGLKAYAEPGKGWKEQWFAMMKEGGFEAPLCWYKSMIWDHHWEIEKTIPPERFVVTVPTFYLGCSRDDVCLAGLIENSKQAGLLPDLTVKEIDSAHWCLMEKPDEVGQALFGFIKKRF